ncbi:MAG: hypothetical protein WCR42_10275 [bacterium]
MFTSLRIDELIKLKEIVGSKNEYDPIQEEANAILFANMYLKEYSEKEVTKTDLIPYSEIFSTESEGYIKMESHNLGIEYQKLIARKFIMHLANEFYECVANTLIIGEFEHGSQSYFRGRYEFECYYKRKSPNCLEKIQIEMIDKTAVYRKDIQNVTGENRGISKITITLTPSYANGMTYRTNLTDIIAFQPLPERFNIFVSKIHHKKFFKSNDEFCECKVFYNIDPVDDFGIVCISLAAPIISYLAGDMEIRRIYNSNRINFSTIGLKIGDEILFENDPKQAFDVGCGDGNPRYRGSQVLYKEDTSGSFSLKLVTRKLMGEKFNDEIDIFEPWTYKGHTLRAIFEENKAKWVVPIEFDVEAEYYENLRNSRKELKR